MKFWHTTQQVSHPIWKRWNKRKERGGSIDIGALDIHNNPEDLAIYNAIVKIVGGQGVRDAHDLLCLLESVVIRTGNKLGNIDNVLVFDEEMQKILKKDAQDRDKKVEAGGYYKWQEENIEVIAGLAEIATRAAYMSVIYVSAQNQIKKPPAKEPTTKKQNTNPPEGEGVYDEYAKGATKNSSSGEVVLGKYNEGGVSYVDTAKFRGSTYFQLDAWDDVAKTIGDNNMWNINKQFLQQQMGQGKNFILSHNPSLATGYYAQEVQFLIENGYRFISDGSLWRAVR